LILVHMSQSFLSHKYARAPRCSDGRRITRVKRKVIRCVKSVEDGNLSNKALSTLDSLLGSGSESDDQSPTSRDPPLVEWWRIRPRQAAPPRTTSISASANPAGRFIANEAMLRNEVWAGRKTLPGQALELPKVIPYESYVISFIQATVYGTIVRVYDTQGADAAVELIAGLGLTQPAVVDKLELWRLLSGCFVQPDLASFAVVLYGMLVVAPSVEASLGYRTFTAVYALSAVVAADVLIATAGGPTVQGTVAAAATSTGLTGIDGLSLGLLSALLLPGSKTLAFVDPRLLCGGLGAVMGLAGSSVAHQLINGDVERQASGASSTSVGKGGSGATAGLTRAGGTVDLRTGLLLAGAAVVVLQHTLEPGFLALAAALGAGFGIGFLLTYMAGPRYQVTREVELPDGSMWIPDPDSVMEMTVVLDQTTSIQRTLTTSILVTIVFLVTGFVVHASGQ
ncbi:hypothetical protein Vretifemale_4316, partial [Volvox reticuliferus]